MDCVPVPDVSATAMTVRPCAIMKGAVELVANRKHGFVLVRDHDGALPCRATSVALKCVGQHELLTDGVVRIPMQHWCSGWPRLGPPAGLEPE